MAGSSLMQVVVKLVLLLALAILALKTRGLRRPAPLRPPR